MVPKENLTEEPTAEESQSTTRTEAEQEEQSSKGTTLEAGVNRPWVPSKDEIKEDLKKDKPSEREMKAEYQRNRKKAIQEILQENVERTVKVDNEGLVSKFEDGAKGGN